MVDPNAPQGLPPGIPPPGGPAAPGVPGAAAPQPTNPTTDPNAMMEVLAALLEEGQAQFAQEQQAALGTAVTQLLRQQPNVAGEAATTLPGEPTAPPMPSDGSAGVEDPTMAGGSGY